MIQRDGLVWTNHLLAPHHKKSSNRTPITPDCSRHNAIKVLVFNFTITCKVICTFVWVPSIPQYNRVPIWFQSFLCYTCSLWKPFKLLSHFTLIKTIISYHFITDITFGCPNSFNTWFVISETIYYSCNDSRYNDYLEFVAKVIPGYITETGSFRVYVLHVSPGRASNLEPVKLG